jgi:glucosamine 6-phosphate synthetase-like amidotransferase/phosphosugar isomerase protein
VGKKVEVPHKKNRVKISSIEEEYNVLYLIGNLAIFHRWKTHGFLSLPHDRFSFVVL